LERRKFRIAFLYAAIVPIRVKIYITNPDMIGAATRIHGYVALCGFGMTRTRNQTVEAIPMAIKDSFMKDIFESLFFHIRKFLMMYFIPLRLD
jgi:hypothetical protein